MSSEVWLPAVGFEKRYQISSLGRVKSNERTAKIRGGLLRPVRERIMTLHRNHGYCIVRLNNGQKMINCKVHRLVAEAFLENPNKLPIVNHKDGDKANNQVINLEWCTYSHNTKHSLQNGLMRPINDLLAEQNKKGHIKATYVFDANGALLGKYDSATSAAKAYNISQSMVSAICLGKKGALRGLYFFSYKKPR